MSNEKDWERERRLEWKRDYYKRNREIIRWKYRMYYASHSVGYKEDQKEPNVMGSCHRRYVISEDDREDLYRRRMRSIRQNMTDERKEELKQRRKESLNRKLQNMTEEQREELELKKKENNKKSYEDLKDTPERWGKHREYQKQYRSNNIENHQEYMRGYHQDNKDKIKESKKNHYENLNDEQKEEKRVGIYEYQKQYRLNNKDKVRGYERKRYLKNKQKTKQKLMKEEMK